jgi:hypothetical protein
MPKRVVERHRDLTQTHVDELITTSDKRIAPFTRNTPHPGLTCEVDRGYVDNPLMAAPSGYYRSVCLLASCTLDNAAPYHAGYYALLHKPISSLSLCIEHLEYDLGSCPHIP